MSKSADDWMVDAIRWGNKGHAAMFLTACLQAQTQPMAALTELSRLAATTDPELEATLTLTAKRLDRLMKEKALGSSSGWVARRSKGTVYVLTRLPVEP